MPKAIGNIIDQLHAAGASLWTIVLVVFGLAIICKGHEYFREIATYFNEKRRINGDLSRKLEKLHLEIAQKRDRLQARKARKAKPKAEDKGS